MKRIFEKGRRVKPQNKYLLVTFFAELIISISILLVSVFNFPMILQVVKQVKPLEINYTYLLINSVISLLVGLGCAVAYNIFYVDKVRQLKHIEKLATMILENGWYEKKTVNNGNGSREKITHFPKMYYRMKDGLLYIKVEIVLGRYQENLLNLEKKLETGLFCELTDKELKEFYIEYTLLYDTISERIGIEDVAVESGSLKLMNAISWEYDALPHMLICGGTGGGKTYFLLTLILAFLKENAKLTILDPKNADLADLNTVIDGVFYKKDDITLQINEFYDAMMMRNEMMKEMENYKTGENYAYLGLNPHFLIFDEYPSFMEMLGRESTEVMNKLKQIVMLGRQSGFFLILACQRADAKYLGDGIRDQFHFRVSLGRVSELGYKMIFGDANKDFFFKRIKGRGYVDVGQGVISEFYTPLVPKKYDFLDEISKVVKGQCEFSTIKEPCENSGAEADEVQASAPEDFT